MTEEYNKLHIELEELLDKNNLMKLLNLDNNTVESFKKIINEYLEYIKNQKKIQRAYSLIPNNRPCVHNLHKKTLHDKLRNRHKLYEPDLTTFLGRLDHLIASILVYVP